MPDKLYKFGNYPKEFKTDSFYGRAKESVLINIEYPRKCFKCKESLDFGFIFVKSNPQFTRKELIKIWKSPHIQLYCCECKAKKEGVKKITIEEAIQNLREEIYLVYIQEYRSNMEKYNPFEKRYLNFLGKRPDTIFEFIEKKKSEKKWERPIVIKKKLR